MKFGEMEFGEMKRNTSNWSNFCMLLRRAGFTASAGLSCLSERVSMTFIVVLAPSWRALQQLLDTPQVTAGDIDMCCNSKKAV